MVAPLVRKVLEHALAADTDENVKTAAAASLLILEPQHPRKQELILRLAQELLRSDLDSEVRCFAACTLVLHPDTRSKPINSIAARVLAGLIAEGEPGSELASRMLALRALRLLPVADIKVIKAAWQVIAGQEPGQWALRRDAMRYLAQVYRQQGATAARPQEASFVLHRAMTEGTELEAEAAAELHRAMNLPREGILTVLQTLAAGAPGNEQARRTHCRALMVLAEPGDEKTATTLGQVLRMPGLSALGRYGEPAFVQALTDGLLALGPPGWREIVRASREVSVERQQIINQTLTAREAVADVERAEREAAP